MRLRRTETAAETNIENKIKNKAENKIKTEAENKIKTEAENEMKTELPPLLTKKWALGLQQFVYLLLCWFGSFISELKYDCKNFDL